MKMKIRVPKTTEKKPFILVPSLPLGVLPVDILKFYPKIFAKLLRDIFRIVFV